MTFGNAGYFLASATFLLLAILLTTSWRGRLQGGLLLLFVVSCIAWGGIWGWRGFHSGMPERLPLIVEVVRNGLLFAFLLNLLQPVFSAKQKKAVFDGIAFVVSGGTLLLLACVLLIDYRFRLFDVVLVVDYRAVYGGLLIMSVAGLVLVEQLFRNTDPEQRWAIKFLFIGVGLIFAYDFFLYSDAMLLQHIDEDIWAGRGFVIAATVPLLAITAARNPKWSLDIFVSRRIVFHSAALTGVGIYLLVMAMAGYYIRIYGGTWGSVAQIVFLFLAVLLLSLVLFSGHARASIRVFINKHFFDYNYDYRDEWLKITDLLSEAVNGAELRRIVIRAIADLVDSDSGMLWARNETDDFVCIERHGYPEMTAVEDADSSLIRFLRDKNWIIDLTEYQMQPESYPGLKLPDWLVALPQAWLVIPMIHHESLYGFLVISNPRLNRTINWEDRDLLKTACKQAASYLVLLQANEALANAEKFAVFNRLSSYVVHDLKNLVAQLDLVVKNADRHRDNPEFIADAFNTVGNATEKMQRLLTQLKKGRFETQEADVLDLCEVLRSATGEYANARPVPELITQCSECRVAANRDRLVSVLGHLIQNAQEATADDGFVRIAVNSEHGHAVIRIQDNGSGMDADFIREKLFAPFETTKGNAGMGVGVYESREFLQALGGSLAVESCVGEGTTFTLGIPLLGDTDRYDLKVVQGEAE